MDLQLTGKRVLVTGASKGIGLATVRAFLDEGAEVLAASRRSTPELEATGVAHIAVDLSTADGPARLIDEVLSREDRLDVLVNNAGGIEYAAEAVTDPFGGDDAAWESALALNLFAAVRATRAALPALSRSQGAVVNVGSDAALLPQRGQLSYNSAKAALAAFSRGLADSLAGAGVRVNVVSPSLVRTDLTTGETGYTARLVADMGLDFAEVMQQSPAYSGLVTGAYIEPEEVARAIVVLASPTMPSAVGSNWGVHAGTVKSPV